MQAGTEVLFFDHGRSRFIHDSLNFWFVGKLGDHCGSCLNSKLAKTWEHIYRAGFTTREFFNAGGYRVGGLLRCCRVGQGTTELHQHDTTRIGICWRL